MPQAVALAWDPLATGRDGDLLRAVAFAQDRGNYRTLCIIKTSKLMPGSQRQTPGILGWEAGTSLRVLLLD
jgi:hypothetical protein